MKITNLVLSIFIFSSSAFAANVHCTVSFNGAQTVNRVATILHTPGEPEGAGTLLIGEYESLKVYVINYPMQIVVNNFFMDVVIDSKQSSVLRSLLLGSDQATLSTTMNDVRVIATCNKIP